MSDIKPIVFVIDDDASVRNSLKLLIESGGWQAETFASGHEFLSRPRERGPSCLVLDVFLPELNGCDVQALIADRSDMPVIFITAYGDVPTTVRAMRAGAVEFLTKPLDGDVLIGAIRTSLERSRVELSHAAQIERLRACYASLSRREREVMALVVAGRMNKHVAGDLGISEITVKAHRGNMMRKMCARSLAELVVMAIKLGLALQRLDSSAIGSNKTVRETASGRAYA